MIASQLVVDRARPMAERLRRLATFAAIPAISAAAWFGYFQIIYGTPNPAVPYGDTSGPDGTHLSYAPGGLTGLLFDEQFGLFIYAPVLVVALIGLASGARDRIGRSTLAIAGVGALYLAIAATYWMWWAGVPATPARLVTATLPMFAVPLARAWSARADRRGAFVLALGLTLALSAIVIGVDRAALAWNVRDSEARWLQWLGPVVNLRRGWPSFFWRLDPGKALSELPFLVHVVLWLILWALAWAVIVRPRRPERVPLAFVWYVLLVVSFGVGLGWPLTGGSSLDPARAQFAVLGEITRGRHALRVDAWTVQRVASPNGIMRITPEEAGPQGTRPWAIWQHVPAGTYQVHLSLTRPRGGQVRVTFGSDSVTPEAIDLRSLSEQAFPIEVPPGADHVSVELDDGLQGVARRIELEPVRLGT
jgi:hypothetical protein